MGVLIGVLMGVLIGLLMGVFTDTFVDRVIHLIRIFLVFAVGGLHRNVVRNMTPLPFSLRASDRSGHPTETVQGWTPIVQE